MSFVMTYNDHNLTDFFRISDISGRGIFNQEITTASISGRSGSIRQGRRIPAREISVEAFMLAKSLEELREKINELNNVLYVNDAVPITFSDEPDITYYGEYAGEPDWEEHFIRGRGTLPFICFDPFKYAEEEISVIKTADDSSATIVTLFAEQADGFEYNPSTVEAQPIFEVEFKDSTDEFKVEHKESKRHLTVVYDFEEGDKLTLDATNRRVQINGETRMQTLALSSEWFNLVSGDNAFDITDGANVTLRYRARRL